MVKGLSTYPRIVARFPAAHTHESGATPSLAKAVRDRTAAQIPAATGRQPSFDGNGGLQVPGGEGYACKCTGVFGQNLFHSSVLPTAKYTFAGQYPR